MFEKYSDIFESVDFLKETLWQDVILNNNKEVWSQLSSSPLFGS